MNHKGFTLLESIIALTLAAIIIYEVGALEIFSRQTSQQIDVQAELLDELNIAFSHMRNRIKRAMAYRDVLGNDLGLHTDNQGTWVQFTADTNRNGRYDANDSTYMYAYIINPGTGIGEILYAPIPGTFEVIADNIVPNPDGTTPTFQSEEINPGALDANQLLVTLTGEKTVEGRNYQVTLQTLITARLMVNYPGL